MTLIVLGSWFYPQYIYTSVAILAIYCNTLWSCYVSAMIANCLLYSAMPISANILQVLHSQSCHELVLQLFLRVHHTNTYCNTKSAMKVQYLLLYSGTLQCGIDAIGWQYIAIQWIVPKVSSYNEEMPTSSPLDNCKSPIPYKLLPQCLRMLRGSHLIKISSMVSRTTISSRKKAQPGTGRRKQLPILLLSTFCSRAFLRQ